MVSSDRSKVVALATLVPALLLGTVLLWQWRNTACTFQEGGPGSGLFVCRQRLLGYELQPGLVRVQAKEGLWPWRRAVDHWVLVDAGAPDTLLFGSYGSSLVKAVERKLRPARRGEVPGQLDLVLLTHAHAIGALPKLLQAYPDAKVAAHADELPWLMSTPPVPFANGTRSLVMRAAGALGLFPTLKQDIPPERMVKLLGEGGDLADAVKAAGPAAKQALRWLPRGVLSYVKVVGHTCGSVAVIHAPSATLLAGDAVAPRRSWLGKVATRAGAGLTVAPSNAGTAAQQAAAKALIMEEGHRWRWLLPLHGGNFSRQQARDLVQEWPDEVSPTPREHKQDQHAAAAASPEVYASRDSPSSHDTAAAGLGLSPGEGASTRSHGPEAGGGSSAEPEMSSHGEL